MPRGQAEDVKVTRRVHRLLKEVQERLGLFKPNTAVSAFMEWLNDSTGEHMRLSHESIEKVLLTLSVMAPHSASELLEKLLHKQVWECAWPQFDPALAQSEEATIALQINGKLRSTISVPMIFEQTDVEPRAKEAVSSWLEGKTIVKVIYVPHKLMNFVVK